MYCTVIKHDGHLRTRGKCRKHEPQASVFYISRVVSKMRSILSQCNTRLRLHLFYDIDFTRANNKTPFFMFYTLMKHGFLTNQSARKVLSMFNNKLLELSGIPGLRLFHLFYDIDFTRANNKTRFLMFYTLIKHGFFTNQSARKVLSIF